MVKKKNAKKEVLKLIDSGCYGIAQKINDGPEEPYEGCVHNLFWILEDFEPTATLLDPSDPQAREGYKTYKVEYDSFMGHCTLYIWG